MSGYIVVTVDGKENLELECNTAGKFLISDLESLIGISAVGLKYVSETSRYRGVRVEAGELLEPNGGWQPESRIYSVVAKREIATADVLSTDAASHIAHSDGGATTVPLEPHSKVPIYIVLPFTFMCTGFSSAAISLTKRQLQVSAKSSLIARRALCQLNKMNGTIRRLVAKTEVIRTTRTIMQSLSQWCDARDEYMVSFVWLCRTN